MRTNAPRGVARLFAATLAGLAILASSSCGVRMPKSLPMDQNPVFSGGIGWIVVSQAYARIKEEPRTDAPDVGHLRGGDIQAVEGRERDPRAGLTWYRIGLGGSAGWLTGDQAVFFDSRDAAERAAGRYR
jgi:hypothetical protein